MAKKLSKEKRSNAARRRMEKNVAKAKGKDKKKLPFKPKYA